MELPSRSLHYYTVFLIWFIFIRENKNMHIFPGKVAERDILWVSFSRNTARVTQSGNERGKKSKYVMGSLESKNTVQIIIY